tara:strand:- start:5673 stop:6572 length:900 start_codon:yes stop_codon:yes gene_type:complete
MSKNVLITGGNGFIARSIYEDFSNCYFSPLEDNIIAPNRKQLDLLDHSEVYDFIKSNKFDVVIHTANYDAVPEFTDKKTSEVLDNNLRMFFNLARCKDYFGKMLYFGSGAEAGREKWTHKMTEAYVESKVPSSQYAYSKHVMNSYAKVSGNIYNLRLFGVFGKFDDWRYRFISNACCKAALGLPVVIKKDIMFDYLFIDDLIKIVKWFITNDPKQNSYNICSSSVYSYNQFAKKVIEASGKDIKIDNIDPIIEEEYSGDNSLFKNESNFNFTNINDSIKLLYEWYDSHIGNIEEGKLLY